MRFVLPGTIEKIASLADNSWRLILGTRELSPKQIAEIGSALNREGFFAFSNDPFTKEETEFLDSMKAEFNEGKKTQSQITRNLLYLLWKQKSEGMTKEDYYKLKTDIYHNNLRSKLL